MTNLSNRPSSTITFFTSIMLLALAVNAGELPPIPSYAQAVEDFESSQPAAKPSAEVTGIMKKSADDLAKAMPDPGLKVGQQAPGFSLPNARGKSISLSEELKKGPVILTFYRGAWCPYCNMQLHGLNKSLPHFRRFGAQLIAVTPQTPDKSLAQFKKDNFPFEVLSDLDSAVIKSYKLYFQVPKELSDLYINTFSLDIAAYNGKGRYELPVPGTYVIDRKGVIRAAFADTDYKERMEPADIVNALKLMKSRDQI